MSEILLINVSGHDKPGLTSSLTSILARYDVEVLDIGQAVIHDTLSLGMLIEIPTRSEPGPVLKDLVFRAHELGVSLKFTPISSDHYNEWVSHQARKRYLLTMLGRRLSALNIATVSGIIADNGLNIHDITRLSRRESWSLADDARRACIELRVHGPAHALDGIRARLVETSAEQGFDVAFQEDSIFRSRRRLVVFDMDSTLIQQEVIDVLAGHAGRGEEVAAITAQAMRGEIEFRESFRRRVELLAGLEESVLSKVANGIEITEGAHRLLANLKKLGYRTAIISGGFTYFGKHLQEHLGIDYMHANELPMQEGRVTGEVGDDIIDGPRKAALLQELARREDIRLEQVIAIGDGANDLPMLGLAGLGIAFHAKPRVREEAGHSISTLGLDGVLYLMGVPDRETS